ncbi:hypothetical protein GCM10027169_15970 [Gordonia jinhuaensis]|uniref:Uncharacterized protein n=1 Tax=Gordonia jinhuaensis TaxID=1517702 RepID=A0A916TKF8_9ACTN|nr:hypothetical protein GCM10011489_39850 [Gordonia jinhuaensis]
MTESSITISPQSVLIDDRAIETFIVDLDRLKGVSVPDGWQRVPDRDLPMTTAAAVGHPASAGSGFVATSLVQALVSRVVS